MPVPKKVKSHVRKAVFHLSQATDTKHLKDYQKQPLDSAHRSLSKWLEDNPTNGEK